MKTLFSVLFILLWAAPLSAQHSTPHTADFRLTAVKEVSPKYTYLYSGKQITGPLSWTGFAQATPAYMLLEAGPTLTTGPVSITTRIGAYIVPTETGARIEHQEALVVYASWRGLSLLSINEFSPVEGIRYYYEQHLSYRGVSAHFEAVFLDGTYRPFLGPHLETLVGPGKMFFWFAWRADGPPGKLVRWGYKFSF